MTPPTASGPGTRHTAPGPVPVPELDYRDTSHRPGWDELPEPVRRAVGEVAGSPVVAVESQPTSGFTAGFAAVLRLRDGGRVFAKAAWSDRPHILEAYAREATVLAALPDAVPAPRLVGARALTAEEAGSGLTGPDHGTWDWEVLVTEALDGRLPQPWTEHDLALVHDACLATVEALTPVPAALAALDLPPLAVAVGQDETGAAYFPALARGEVGVTWGQPPWVAERAGELAALAGLAGTLLDGDSACHSDLRADNLLVTADSARLVDWNWMCVGAAWSDFVGLLPLARADGVDVDAWVRRSPLTRDADPEALDAWLAVIAAYMLAGADLPPFKGGREDLRVHQRRYARTFLDWLAHRRGWE